MQRWLLEHQQSYCKHVNKNPILGSLTIAKVCCTSHRLLTFAFFVIWKKKKSCTSCLSCCYLVLVLQVDTLNLSVLKRLISEDQVGLNQVTRWTRRWGVLVHRSKVICQKQEVGAIRLQDISSGHQCELHVRLPVRVLRKGQSVSHLRRLSRGWGRVGILLINTKGAPPRTSHHDESGVYLLVALCSFCL